MREDHEGALNVVLVTNVGHGFGRAIALSYSKDDFDVVCADKDVDLASKTAAEIEEMGGHAIPVQADMTSQADVRNVFDKILEIFGKVNGVVHVAPYESHARFREMGEAEFDDVFEENLKSTFLVLKSSAVMMEEGWVVLIAPPSNLLEPHMLSVRGALSDMASSFEKRHDDLRVNVVVPSRSASDPKHDAALVQTVRYFGSAMAMGVSGHQMRVKLPPPPDIADTLLPEVLAALDETIRQDDLEASLYDDFNFLNDNYPYNDDDDDEDYDFPISFLENVPR